MSDAGVPRLAHVFDLRVLVGAPLEVGDAGGGERRVIPILGGTVFGPRLAGRVLPGGTDYQLIRSGGLTEVHARYVLELEGSGALAYVENTGLRFGPSDALARLRRGEAVDPALIYFRSAPRFETASLEHAWLMQHLFLATGIRHPDRVELAVFQVL